MEFTCRFRVGMAAVDAAGRIFFPELFRLAQECAEAFLESRGLVLADWMTDGTHLLPVVHAEADYLRPIRLGDRLEARLHVARIGNTSFTLAIDFQREADVPVARARVVHACIATAGGRPVPLPEPLRVALATGE